MNNNIDERIMKIYSHFGPHTQIIKTIEELSELSVELSKYLYYKDRVGLSSRKYCALSSEKITEELADVEIMITQLKYCLLDSRDVEEQKEKKLSRTMKYINGLTCIGGAND